MIRCYARVSSKGQEKYGNGLESQVAELKAAGGEKFYTDAYTGTSCSRPNFDKLLEELEPNDKQNRSGGYSSICTLTEKDKKFIRCFETYRTTLP